MCVIRDELGLTLSSAARGVLDVINSFFICSAPLLLTLALAPVTALGPSAGPALSPVGWFLVTLWVRRLLYLPFPGCYSLALLVTFTKMCFFAACHGGSTWAVKSREMLDR